MSAVKVDVVRLPHGKDLPLPAYATVASAGMDLLNAEDGAVTIEPGKRAMIATGIAIQLPSGYEAQVRPRSGLAAKHGITVLNSPGTIDADYRGEIKVILVNLGDEAVTLKRSERIAQMVVAPVTQVVLHEVDTLEDSDRGAGGFGSTGTGS
ncbi:MAG: dUTP diphosphatase [Rhodospirillales bacterium]|nr:dUTP diphosphatase [Rhodospirillales bacterium]